MSRIFPALLLALLATPMTAQTNLPDTLVWPLTLLDGAEPGFVATISLEQPGLARGRGPCNGFSAPLSAALPAFKVDSIMATRMACPDLDAEQQFFGLLRQMEHAELGDRMLTLTGAGHVMVFGRPD